MERNKGQKEGEARAIFYTHSFQRHLLVLGGTFGFICEQQTFPSL